MNAPEARPDPAAPHAQPPPPPLPAGWHHPPSAADPRRKSPLIACLLSILPGLGQVYVGYYKLGFIHMAVFASAWSIAVALSGDPPAAIPLIVVFMVFFFLYSVIDAGRRATFYNQALDGIDGVQLPTEMSLPTPTPGGSIAGGAALILVGAVLLSHTALDLSLRWLEDWWPLAPILVGAWLLARGLMEGKGTD
jgi:hypothetical protein